MRCSIIVVSISASSTAFIFRTGQYLQTHAALRLGIRRSPSIKLMVAAKPYRNQPKPQSSKSIRRVLLPSISRLASRISAWIKLNRARALPNTPKRVRIFTSIFSSVRLTVSSTSGVSRQSQKWHPRPMSGDQNIRFLSVQRMFVTAC